MSILCLAIQIVFVVSIVAAVYYFRLYKLHGISVKEWEEMKEDNFLMRELLNNLPIPTTVKDIKDNCNYLFWNKKSEDLYSVSGRPDREKCKCSASRNLFCLSTDRPGNDTFRPIKHLSASDIG